MTDREMLELCRDAFEAIHVQRSVFFMKERSFEIGIPKGKTISQRLAATMQDKLREHLEIPD